MKVIRYYFYSCKANFYMFLQAESPANIHFQKYEFQNAEAKQLFCCDSEIKMGLGFIAIRGIGP